MLTQTKITIRKFSLLYTILRVFNKNAQALLLNWVQSWAYQSSSDSDDDSSEEDEEETALLLEFERVKKEREEKERLAKQQKYDEMTKEEQ